MVRDDKQAVGKQCLINDNCSSGSCDVEGQICAYKKYWGPLKKFEFSSYLTGEN